MKILRVVDPHVKPGNLEESKRLLTFIVDKAIELKVNCLEIEGDLWDTHSIVRLEVTEFWDKYFNLFTKQSFKTVILVGNHDISGDYSNSYSSLHPFLSLENEKFKIVHEPYIDGIYGYLPYIHDNERFITEANKLADQGATVLVAHPTFEGAVYDNGTPALDCIDVNKLSPKFLHLIGGHVHTEVEIGRVWYPGTARWLTKSCANKRKGLWLCTHDDTGLMTSKEFISTESVCTPIASLVWKENEEKPAISDNAKTYLELVGSSDWVTKAKKELVGSVSVSSKITDIKKSRERKSGKSLHEFLSHHYEADSEKRQKLIKYLGDLNLV